MTAIKKRGAEVCSCADPCWLTEFLLLICSAALCQIFDSIYGTLVFSFPLWFRLSLPIFTLPFALWMADPNIRGCTNAQSQVQCTCGMAIHRKL